MTMRDRAAKALDQTHSHAARKIGIHTDICRDTLACWLDGTFKTKISTIRQYVEYLEMVGRTATR